MKKFVPVFLILGALFSAAVPAAPTSAISDEQRSAISQNCSSIRQSLRTLQRSDSRTRVYLGSVYQTVLSSYMTQLNLRLVKANLPNATLASSQSEFTDARDDFSKKFITYSQSLEELLMVDCVNNPDEFYEKLATTREQRSALSAATAKVRKILNNHIDTVARLKEEFEDVAQ